MTTSAVAVFQVILQLLFIADVSRRRVHLPEHDRSKPGRQIVTFLLICNVAMYAIYTFDAQKVFANPVSRYVRERYMKICFTNKKVRFTKFKNKTHKYINKLTFEGHPDALCALWF